jgi:hypothetical protein
MSNGIMAWKYGHTEVLKHDYKRDHSVPDDEQNNLQQQTVGNQPAKEDLY